MTTFTEDRADPFHACTNCGREEENLYRQGNARLCEECHNATDGLAMGLVCALAALPPLYATEGTRLDQKTTTLRFKVLGSSWEWYPVEFSPEERLFFGYVLGDCPEWGYFSLDELLSLPFFFWETFEATNLYEMAKREE